MVPIERSDPIELPLPPAKVFPVLLDLPGYPGWWPQKVRFKVLGPLPVQVGTRVRIANGPWVEWTARIEAIVPERSIRFRYSEGAWEGTAEWLLEGIGTGCKVTYRISIRPAQGWLKLLGKVLDLGELHSKEMRGVLERLRSALPA